MNEKLENKELGLPDDEPLPNTQIMCPYMIVADDAFPLRREIMKPYSRRGLEERELILNYRLSRARRVVENVFGILSNRFRIFRAPMISSTTTAVKVVKACAVLHNFLRRNKRAPVGNSAENEEDDVDNDDVSVVGNGLARLPPVTAGRQPSDAKALREQLADYFMSVGRVPWQEKSVRAPIFL